MTFFKRLSDYLRSWPDYFANRSLEPTAVGVHRFHGLRLSVPPASAAQLR